MAAKTTVRSNFSGVSSAFSIGMAMFISGVFLLILLIGKKTSDHLRENVVMSVYLQENHSAGAKDSLALEIKAMTGVKSVGYIDKDSAARALEKDLGQDFVSVIGYNPLPRSLEVRMKPEFATREAMQIIKSQILKNVHVMDVEYQETLLDKINENIRIIGAALFSITIIMLLIAVALIHSNIRLGLYSRRFLIRSMQLVGATSWFITRPFIAKSVLFGLIGGILAVLFLFITYLGLASWIPDLEGQIQHMELLIIGGSLLISAILISAISTLFATRKYLKLRLEDLY